MKNLTFRVLVVSALTSVLVFMGCHLHGDTLESVTVTPANQSMANGTSQYFTATATFTNHMTLYWSQVVTWSSSNTAVATVSNTAGINGLVTSVGYGTAVITALDEANNITGSATLLVTDPKSIAVAPVEPFLAIGTTFQMATFGTFTDGTTEDVTAVASWQSDNPTVATIGDTAGSKGIVTAAITGTTTILATYLTFTGTTLLTVKDTALASIAINEVNPSIVNGTNQPFTVLGTFGDGSTVDMTKSVIWSSSNTDVATISNATGSIGLATSVSAGSTTITATDPVTKIAGSTTLTITSM